MPCRAEQFLVQQRQHAAGGNAGEGVSRRYGLLREEAAKRFPNVFFPERKFSGDNGAMVAAAAYYEIKNNVEPTDPYKLNIMPRSEIK